MYDSLPENSFIKKLLFGIDSAFTERFLTVKRKYETASDKEDKRLYREQLSGLFWELYAMVAVMINPELSTAKRLFLRFGIIDLRNLSPEDQKFILGVPSDTPDYDTGNIFYADEWLQGVALGKIRPSAGDETKSAAPARPASAKRDKHSSLLNIEARRFEDFVRERGDALLQLKHVHELLSEEFTDDETNYKGIYTPEQLKALESLASIQKDIRKLSKEISASAKAMRKAQDALDLIDAADNEEPADPDKGIILSEVANIRQMHKMTVGRQGNSSPFLTSGFLPKETKDYLFRGMVKKKLNHWLSLDPEAFQRTYKGETLNIQPYMILVPGYGISGACWEPLDAENKQFGRGRMVLPLFTRTPDLTLLSAMADMRWQSAKETASYYWMEEGLTGRYYEYYLEAKLKGDLKTLFITDYILWMTKETQGIQKLEQNARYVFWRYVPLPDENKAALANKGYYYNQLWEKEQVWRKSKNA